MNNPTSMFPGKKQSQKCQGGTELQKVNAEVAKNCFCSDFCSDFLLTQYNVTKVPDINNIIYII